MRSEASPIEPEGPHDHLLPPRAVSFVVIGGLLAPALIGPPIRWAMGTSGLSFGQALSVAIVLAVTLLPVAILVWRRLLRPQLVVGPHVIEQLRGRAVIRTVPREDVLSVEVRPFVVSGRLVCRSVTLGLQSGHHVSLSLPDDLRLPGFRDRRFDERVQSLRTWALAAPPAA